MRGCLTNPLVLFLIILLFVGFVGGPIGAGFLGVPKPTGYIGAPRLHIQLPAEGVVHIWEHPYAILSFAITNTMLTAFLATVFLLFISWCATRRMRMVPKGIQNMMEAFVEMFLNLTQSVAGKEWGRRFLPLVATIFLFIITSNWAGLLPGFGTIGVVEEKYAKYYNQINIAGLDIFYVPFGGVKEEAKGFIPFFRSANSDVNIPLAMAIIGMFIVQIWGIKALGLLNYVQKYINVRQILRGKVVIGISELGAGLLEIAGQLAQIISLTFRLFGNIFAGEVLLIIVAFLFPLAWILPFFGLELIIGAVQALIFAMLILVFSTLAVAGHNTRH